ncbi:sensor histidine kinase [Coralliovum pocilloporae]|uniref:sensor histidine kinase n=1 Tax=Coralliovum pocilloporae TaxID=3066369 RepID=UPI003307C242
MNYSQEPLFERFLNRQATGTRPGQVFRTSVQLRLSELRNVSGLSDIRLLGADGRIVSSAATFGQTPSFLEQNYFARAWNGSLGRAIAIDPLTSQLSYYLARGIRFNGQTIGVIVLVIPLDHLQQEFRANTHEIFIADRNNLIVLSGHPDWRLKVLGGTRLAQRYAADDLAAFALDAPVPAPIEIRPFPDTTDFTKVIAVADRSDQRPMEFLRMTRWMPLEGWELNILIPLAPVRQQILTILAVAVLAFLLVAMVFVVVLQRRRRLLDLVHEREQSQQMLKQKVAERTRDLQALNLELTAQVDDRIRAEKKLRRTQTELIQAGKMAALGQMSAELRHEINQPLAAIRNYVETTAILLDRNQYERAEDNIGRMRRIIGRMENLSYALTKFSQKPKEGRQLVNIGPILDRSLELLHPRLKKQNVHLEKSWGENIRAYGEENLLNTVFVNLISNAIDATMEMENPHIACSAIDLSSSVLVVIEDNGPGLDDEAISQAFNPFFTTKDAGQGLGLGLSISYNSINELGGKLRAENRDRGGARFIVELAKEA